MRDMTDETKLAFQKVARFGQRCCIMALVFLGFLIADVVLASGFAPLVLALISVHVGLALGSLYAIETFEVFRKIGKASQK